MIVCITLAMFILILYYWKGSDMRALKIFIASYVSMMLILTIAVTSRVYQSEAFELSYPANACKIIHFRGDIMKVETPKGEWLVDKRNIVEYKAPNKESEVVEIRGEHRLYRSAAPDVLYYLYYLSSPVETTEDVISSVNVSSYK